jgi:ankyrin repeat protein
MQGLRGNVRVGNAQNSQKIDMLFTAAIANDQGRLRGLISEGVDKNAKDLDGMTPAMHSAAWGRMEILRVLFEVGGRLDLDATDKNGHNACWHACANGQRRTLEYLLNFARAPLFSSSRLDPDPYAFLTAAALGHHQDTVNYLLSLRSSPPVSSLSERAKTSLFTLSIRFNDTSLFHTLLQSMCV